LIPVVLTPVLSLLLTLALIFDFVGGSRVHKTTVNRSVTAVTGLTEPARLLKPTGNRSLTVPMNPRFSANRSVWLVYRSGFFEFENCYCSGFVNPGWEAWRAFG
jgi:hypothetical protein